MYKEIDILEKASTLRGIREKIAEHANDTSHNHTSANIPVGTKLAEIGSYLEGVNAKQYNIQDLKIATVTPTIEGVTISKDYNYDAMASLTLNIKTSPIKECVIKSRTYVTDHYNLRPLYDETATALIVTSEIDIIPEDSNQRYSGGSDERSEIQDPNLEILILDGLVIPKFSGTGGCGSDGRYTQGYNRYTGLFTSGFPRLREIYLKNMSEDSYSNLLKTLGYQSVYRVYPAEQFYYRAYDGGRHQDYETLNIHFNGNTTTLYARTKSYSYKDPWGERVTATARYWDLNPEP